MPPVNDREWMESYDWLCSQRRNAPPDSDIWDLRWRWEQENRRLFLWVISGCYQLSPMLITGWGKQSRAMWSARDALVLKWVSLKIQNSLPQHEACMHLRGRGTRLSLRQVRSALNADCFRFVHRTDIRGYYEHMRKPQIIHQVNRYVTSPVCRELIRQYVYYSVERGGEIRTPQHGIPRGCALSPLIGGSLLRHIDGWYSSFDSDEVFYARYMDDFLLLTRTRWQLRRGISRLAEFFDLSGFERHPEKRRLVVWKRALTGWVSGSGLTGPPCRPEQ